MIFRSLVPSGLLASSFAFALGSDCSTTGGEPAPASATQPDTEVDEEIERIFAESRAQQRARTELGRHLRYLSEPRDILRGLQGVNVGVILIGLDPDAELRGLTKQALKTDVELRLRELGIPVLSLEQLDRENGCPCLNLKVRILKNGGLFAYSLDLYLVELVTPSRDPTRTLFARVWNSSLIGTVGIQNIQQLRKVAIDTVNEFANDYLAANPKK